MTIIGLWLEEITQQLISVSDTPTLEAQVIAAHILHKPRSWIIAHVDQQISSTESKKGNALIVRRCSGEPLPYLLGHWEFYGLNFFISNNVLIPRPETELLVDHAISFLKGNRNALVVDVGSGSGCIAISIAMNTQANKILATDISFPALQVADQNRLNFGLADRLQLINCDLLLPFETRFNLICANLPYIPSLKLNDLHVSKHEPKLALDGGNQGIDFIERLLVQAASRLRPQGCILLEIEETTSATCLDMARYHFPLSVIEICPDHAGKPRLMIIKTESQ